MNLALFHPRLFHGLVLLDPVIQSRSAEILPGVDRRKQLAAMSTFRRERWGSREEAAASFARSPFYKKWDKRCLARWVEFGLREGRSMLYPEAEEGSVGLTTPNGQEVYTFLRPNFEGKGGKVDWKRTPDVDPGNENNYPFYRREPNAMWDRIEELRPGVLFVIGGESNINGWGGVEDREKRMGTGIGGSGGKSEGRVESVTLEDVGHLVPIEEPTRTAEIMAKWLGKATEMWHQDQEDLQKTWYAKILKEKQQIGEEWKRHMGGEPVRAKKSSKI